MCDQLEGNERHHREVRAEVAAFIEMNREDFAPFVEDDMSFEAHCALPWRRSFPLYTLCTTLCTPPVLTLLTRIFSPACPVRELRKPGEYVGNDAVVAFARMRNLAIIIHRLGQPRWVVCGSDAGIDHVNGHIHLAYHEWEHCWCCRRSLLSARLAPLFTVSTSCSPPSLCPPQTRPSGRKTTQTHLAQPFLQATKWFVALSKVLSPSLRVPNLPFPFPSPQPQTFAPKAFVPVEAEADSKKSSGKRKSATKDEKKLASSAPASSSATASASSAPTSCSSPPSTLSPEAEQVMAATGCSVCPTSNYKFPTDCPPTYTILLPSTCTGRPAGG